MGDPAGIGPLVITEALEKSRSVLESHRVIVIGCGADLQRAAERLGRGWTPQPLPGVPWSSDPEVEPGRVGFVEASGGHWQASIPGEPTRAGGHLQVAAIDDALQLVEAKRAQAIVTGPVSKVAIVASGTPFTGHTEHLAKAAGLAADDVTMMFAGPHLRVALLTTHLALADVPRAITRRRVEGTILRLIEALERWWRVPNPKVVVLGLNPHAGEEGLFGTEELELLAPTVQALQEDERRCAGARIDGPVPSETGLRGVVEGRWDGAVALYHDQATIPCKLLDMGRSVNVTLGLPFLRTSVDHGVAYDAALTGQADPGSMIAALKLAAELTV